MIVGIFHEGSGLGNQLHRYVMTRVLARDKGLDYGMIGNFKGSSFMNLDIGKPTSPEDLEKEQYDFFVEKKIVADGIDIRGYDPEINFVGYNSVIDGEFQDSKYFEHRITEIRKWLRVKTMKVSDDVCIIGFRGGEYTQFPDLFLTKDYWNDAISQMKTWYPNITFKVVTDDPTTAREFFPDFEISHEIGDDWRSIRYAKHLIIANSSFFILPALLNQEVKEVIAPRYWARRNSKVWALPQNYYRKFLYI